MRDDLANEHGTVHGLVNNAGITHRARLLELHVADLERVLAVNLTGPLLGIQALAPLMTDGGSIVNIGSVAALTAHYPVAYTASKWALRGLAQVAAMELGPPRIRVNTIHPGFIQTPMTASASEAFRAPPRGDPARQARTARRSRRARRLPALGRSRVHHRRRDPRRRRPDRARRRQSDLRRAPHPRPCHRRTVMFEYFPGNYVWNLSVLITLHLTFAS